MKRKLYLNIALLVVILGGFGVLVFMQHAPATDTSPQDATDVPATGCCGTSKVKDETPESTAGGCCGTPTAETVQGNDVLQQAQTQVTSETGKAVPQTPQSDKADTGGCGCGSQ